MNEPMEMPYAKCRELLAAGVVGRVGLCTPKGPQIFPVNYSMVSEAIVFRTTPYGVVASHDWRSPIAFEIDRARQLCERLLAYASPLELYAEEIDPYSGRHLGNFPQAFTHLALINAVTHVIRAQAESRATGFNPANRQG